MIKFELEGKKYRTKEGWHEVPFEMFMDYLSKIAPQEPEELKEFIAGHLEFISNIEPSLSEEEKETLALSNWNSSWNKMSKKSQIKCEEFFAIEIGFWCGLDSEIVRGSMNRTQLTQAFWDIQFTLNMMNVKEDKEFVGFSCKGREFLLPSKHMEGSTVAEFAEAAQFEENVGDLMQDKWYSMLDVMVVLCRPKGEKYSFDQQNHDIRKKMFKGLNMDTIINVAFFLLRQNDILRDNLLIFSLQGQVDQKKQLQLQKLMDGL